MRPIDFIVESVTAQGDGKNLELHKGMLEAYQLTQAMRQVNLYLDAHDIRIIAAKVANSPYQQLPYRDMPVSFADGSLALDAQHIDRQMNTLLLHQADIPAAVFFQRLMEIHPFFDFNGRTGALVFNFLNGTIDNPIHPPEFRK